MNFLDRTRKSLDILQEKSQQKDKKRVPRSRSVHTAHGTGESSPSRAISLSSSSSTSSTCSAGSTSRFARAKSVTQISQQQQQHGGLREFTWSVLRRNDSSSSTQPPRANSTKDESYVGQKPAEIDPDEVPPAKLAQEAFRLFYQHFFLFEVRFEN